MRFVAGLPAEMQFAAIRPSVLRAILSVGGADGRNSAAWDFRGEPSPANHPDRDPRARRPSLDATAAAADSFTTSHTSDRPRGSEALDESGWNTLYFRSTLPLRKQPRSHNSASASRLRSSKQTRSTERKPTSCAMRSISYGARSQRLVTRHAEQCASVRQLPCASVAASCI
jgi:hypothetical protein